MPPVADADLLKRMQVTSVVEREGLADQVPEDCIVFDTVTERAASPLAPGDYLAVGLRILDENGSNRALSVRRVCNELGSTTGSFYHHFPTWSAYLRAVVMRWVETHHNAIQQLAGANPPDPARVIQVLLSHPPALERAIRCWPGEITVAAVAAVDLMWQDVIVRAAHGEDDTPATADAVRAATVVRAVAMGLASTGTFSCDRRDLVSLLARHVEIVTGHGRLRSH
ncbi:TetR family transcriptional regulator [Pseudonocardia alni]|jgi:AcrR family transcriptional regulator|uniref:TetR family transcriptional regulator n=1 Tax=Pseudonocardia alni TaxID=33907 RepID=A0AA44UV34_PSEA5|nr:TetR family transcriptional regulator [Pseudonocardia alni]